MARRFTYQLGVDFIETTLSIVALTSVQIPLAIATKQEIDVKQHNVDSTFVYGELSKEIYLDQPKGFKIDRANSKKLVCKLHKSHIRIKASWHSMVETYRFKIKGFRFHELYQGCMYIHLT